ncbi:MAG TPA: hypothetical protein VKO20_05100 [Desulfosalsimonadaceae bacterium]|nr:hypothetical protein [Desulfosalsimonadaceae bacterium]
MTAAQNIQNALAAFLDEPGLAPALAEVLNKCRGRSGVFYEEIAAAAGADAAELILLAWDWRLLLPRRSSQCAEWDDRILALEPGEIYDMANIVAYLLDSAAKSGTWDVDDAVRALYAAMREPHYREMPALVRGICQGAQNGCINAAKIHTACTNAGIHGLTGAMIGILKGGGVISPKLMSASPAEKKGSPVYEVHPALLAAPGMAEGAISSGS